MDAVFLSNGTMVLMGGQDLSKCFSDVWVSHDGAETWEQLTDSAPWGIGPDGTRVGRSAYKTLVVNDQIYMVGGDHGSFYNRKFFGDVWMSPDGGRSWEMKFNGTAQPAGKAWRPRAGMQVVKVKDSLFFMGGDNDQYSSFHFERYNDIWRSDDMGASWGYVGQAAWGNRTGHQCFSPDDACVYCVGGQGNPECNKKSNLLYHDVWKSCDGAKTWSLVAEDAFGCDPTAKCGDAAYNCGLDDFLTRRKDGRWWLMAGDAEKSAPFPMSNGVWTLEDDQVLV